ncbi:MAG: polysaccharide deacetylase family protein [Roseburia sp.]|nr:polysaccharide deacetylase family protein [Roseburia sp.]
MKKLFSFVLVLCLCLSGCTKTPNDSLPNIYTETEQSDTSSDNLLEEYLANPDILETPIREYGESTAFIQLEEDLGVRIAYPETELDDLNQAIESWITDTVSYFEYESADAIDMEDSAELTVDYDSYLTGNIVSVKFSGLYDKPYLAHPIDIIATFHADLSTGKLLSLDGILTSDGRTALQNMVINDASLEAEIVDKHLLDLWALTSDGLEIILERGDYLPMSAGTVTLSYSYDELKNILLLPVENESEVSETEELTETELTENAQNNLPVTTIDPDKPMVALTFDDGPSKHTTRLLDIFATYGGKGTFFVVGNLIDNRADAVKRMAEEGHEVAGHSWSHRQLTKLTPSELTDQIMTTRAKIYEVTGVDSTVIRPPYGAFNSDVKEVCANLGIVMVNWSVDTLDWKNKNADMVYNAIMKDVKDGAIILCHDLHSTTVDAMERVIPDLIEQGYQLVTVSELLSCGDEEVCAGNVYNKR